MLAFFYCPMAICFIVPKLYLCQTIVLYIHDLLRKTERIGSMMSWQPVEVISNW